MFSKISALERLTPKYLWWEPVSDRGFEEDRILAQIMNIGDFFDMQEVEKEVGKERLRQVIAKAQPGWFNPRSWHFWHYRLGITNIGDDVPPLKTRTFGQ